MTWAAFAKAVEGKGLRARQCSSVHWRIEGGAFSVNYYPTSGTIYINGFTRVRGMSRFIGTVEDAIRYALGEERITVRSKDAQAERKNYRHRKRWIFRRQKFCWWCNTKLTLKTATVDHLIPLSRGGSNGTDNLVLACAPCNKARGNELGPPPKLAERCFGFCAYPGEYQGTPRTCRCCGHLEVTNG